MISNIDKLAKIITLLSFLALISCIKNPVPMDLEAQHTDERHDPELNYISSVIEKDDSTLIAICDSKLFKISKNPNHPDVEIIYSGNFFTQYSGLYKDKTGKIIFYDNYNLFRINFFNGTCSFDTLLEDVHFKICQDDSGNLWLLKFDYGNAYLNCWDGQTLERKWQTESISYFPQDFFILSDNNDIFILVQLTDDVRIYKYSSSDFYLSDFNRLNMDSCTIKNAFIVGDRLNLLLQTRKQWMPSENSDSSTIMVNVKNQIVLASVENSKILFRAYICDPNHYDSSPLLKNGPDKCWNTIDRSVYLFTPDEVRSISFPQNNVLYINRTGEVMMFYNPTLKSVLLSDAI